MLKFNCDPTYVKCNSMLWNFSDFLEVVFYFRAKRSMMSAYKTYYEERAKALGNCQKLDYILSFPRLLCSALSTGKNAVVASIIHVYFYMFIIHVNQSLFNFMPKNAGVTII